MLRRQQSLLRLLQASNALRQQVALAPRPLKEASKLHRQETWHQLVVTTGSSDHDVACALKRAVRSISGGSGFNLHAGGCYDGAQIPERRHFP